MPTCSETLRDLESQYGDSFYLVDLDSFRANFEDFRGAFSKIYPNTNIAYSYKTNYTPGLCQLVNDWGGYAEVVSRMEYDLAIRIGVAPDRIIFNGPYKQLDDIEHAAVAGSIVNLDALYQVPLAVEVAKRHPSKDLNFGLRVTFDVQSGEGRHLSRFGFDAHGEELAEVLKTVRACANINIVGLHCHFWTPNRAPETYGRVAERMLQLTNEHFDAPPRLIDLGGGYFSRMSEQLQAQFDYPIATYSDYAEVIATKISRHYPAGDGPELILEPGMAITANIAKFVAKIIDIHTLGSRQLVLVSGSFHNVSPNKSSSKNLPVEIVPTRQVEPIQANGNIEMVGYTCMESDVLFDGDAGPVSVGDYVVFDNIGAYTNVFKPPFIKACPPMLGWSASDDGFTVLKRQETLEDIFQTYVLG